MSGPESVRLPGLRRRDELPRCGLQYQLRQRKIRLHQGTLGLQTRHYSTSRGRPCHSAMHCFKRLTGCGVPCFLLPSPAPARALRHALHRHIFRARTVLVHSSKFGQCCITSCEHLAAIFSVSACHGKKECVQPVVLRKIYRESLPAVENPSSVHAAMLINCRLDHAVHSVGPVALRI